MSSRELINLLDDLGVDPTIIDPGFITPQQFLQADPLGEVDHVDFVIEFFLILQVRFEGVGIKVGRVNDHRFAAGHFVANQLIQQREGLLVIFLRDHLPDLVALLVINRFEIAVKQAQVVRGDGVRLQAMLANEGGFARAGDATEDV